MFLLKWRQSFVCSWVLCLQSWPPSPSGTSLKEGDELLADLLTWWRAILSSLRTSWSRRSSPSVALYVLFFSFKIHFWLGLNSIPLVLMFDSCTMCIIIMMNDSQTLPVSAALCPFPFTDSFDSPVTLLPAGCPDQTAWHLQENWRWVHDQQNCNPG